MKNGPYKKVLFRVPADVLAFLAERSEREVRSINAEWVYLLRQVMKKEQDAERRTPTLTP
jgi:hypothetical protein